MTRQARILHRSRRHRVTATLTLSLLGLFALLGTPGCRKPAEGDGGKHEAAAPISVRVAHVERRRLRPAVAVIGSVLADPERLATLTAATTGLVERLAVREGAKVSKGDLIVQLDERKARIDLMRAEAALARLIAKPRPEEVAQARALVEKMQAAHVLAQLRFKRTQELRARNPELVPELQLLEDQRNEQTARSEFDAAQAQLELQEKGPREEQRKEMQVEVDAARLQLELCRVTTPLAGEVIEVKARLGQRADLGTPLATVLDTSEVWVQGRVPSDRLSGVAQSLRERGKEPLAQVRCPSFPEVLFPSASGWLSEQTEGSTSDIPIKLRVPNAAGLLRVGMTVQVTLFEAAVEDLAIPETAFTVNEEGKHVVTVIRDGKAAPAEIELAADGGRQVRADGWVRVVKGLKQGDAVAIENGYALPEGTPVTVLHPTK